MVFFTRLPDNPYWPSRTKTGMTVLQFIALMITLYTIFTVAALGYSATHPFRSSVRVGYEEYQKGSSGVQWDEGPGTSAAEVFIRMAPVFVEMFHIPIAFVLYGRGGHHPVAALSMGCIMLAGWIDQTWWRAFVDFVTPEVPLSSAWLGLSYTCVAIMSFISLMYFVYVGYAAAAVHVWRREKRARKHRRSGSIKVENGAAADGFEMDRKV